MRILAALVLASLVAMAIAMLPRSARCDVASAANEQSDVKVSIAVVENTLTPQSVLHVIIENISRKPQKHFVERYSWGYGNITLRWTDGQGKTGTVAKVPGEWDKNVPATVVLQPGDSLVRDIAFDPKLWTGWPRFLGLTTLTVKAIYHSTGEPKIPNADGWIGKVTSNERTISIWQSSAR